MDEELVRSIQEAKTYMSKAFGREPTDKEILTTLESLLEERRVAELKKRFMSWRPEHIRQVITGFRQDVKDKGVTGSNK